MSDAEVPLTPMSGCELLAVRAGGKVWVLPLAGIVEVVRPPTIAELPRCPPALRGAAQHRGEVIAVIDLALRLELTPEPTSPKERMVVVQAHVGKAGLLVAEVLGVWRDGAVVDGAVQRRGEMFGLLDLDQLVQWKE